MKQLTAEEKVFLVIYSRSHNIDETIRVFGVSRATVTRYKKKYDGTEESLADKRKSNTRIDSFSQEEKARYIDLLIEYNKPNVKRLNLAPIITTLHCADLERRRSYQATGNKLRELKEEVFPTVECSYQRSGKYYVRTERKEYHAAKKPGTLQIDMMYISLECYCEAMSSPENIVKLRQRVIADARIETEVVIGAYQEEAQKNPQVRSFLLYSCKEVWKEFQQICDDIMSCSAEELLPRRFYQYTAVDECTGWAYRQIYITHSEASAMLFMAEVYEHAPFKIEKVQTDNGSEFTSKYLNNHGPDYETPFEQYLRTTGIKYYRIQPGKPWQNGRVECQHRLDRERFYSRIKFSSLEEAQELLAKYNEESNHYYRPSRGGKSAMEQLMEFQRGDVQ